MNVKTCLPAENECMYKFVNFQVEKRANQFQCHDHIVSMLKKVY